jgi:hypothetical protein
VIVKLFDESLSRDWNQALETSRNGIFLFHRDYMGYHQERFDECSLIAYSNGLPIAVLPATRIGNEAISHSGLTFGGIIFDRQLRFEQVSEVVDGFLATLRSVGVEKLTIKLVPEFLWKYPAGEVPYLLWRKGFTLSRRDLSQLLPFGDSLPLNKSKRAAIQKARKSGLTTREGNVDEVHALITQVLASRHGVDPVHSKSDLALLQSRFPDHILLRSATSAECAIAAVVIYKYGAVWHTQYLATSEQGRELGALDLLISTVIDEAKTSGALAMSFGTSSEEQGTRVNIGLAWQKESFGARSVCHDFMTGSI